MNLLRIAIVSLLLSPGAHAQVTRQPLPVATPVLRPEPNVIVAPPVETKVRAAAPASAGKISERAPAGAQMGLPAVQRPGQVVRSGPIQLTPLDAAPAPTPVSPVVDKAELDQRELQEATQRESRRVQTLSNVQKQKHDAAKNAIQNMK